VLTANRIIFAMRPQIDPISQIARIIKKGRMDDVEENGSGQDDARNPMISHPGTGPNFRQEGVK